jgi:hypothetical protein
MVSHRTAFAASLLVPLGCLFVPLWADDHHGHAPGTPHPNDPVLRAEHMKMLDLVTDKDVTHTAAQDGSWADKATWKDGKVPDNGATVLVPKGRVVSVDGIIATPLRALRVDGELTFATDRDTGLSVDTLVIAPAGRLIVGTEKKPVAAGRRATITFTDSGAIDAKRDPALLGRGLIAHGEVSMHGAPVTPFVALQAPPTPGATKLTLPRPPEGWKVGDTLLLAGTGLGRNEDEELPIVALDGAEVTVPAIKHKRDLPTDGLSVYLANLSRNVVLRSENARDPSRSGHIMFMHSPKVTLANVAFLNLGRTDKRNPVNDPKPGTDGVLATGTGTNPRGRYAVHFHRTGVGGHDEPAKVRGCVVQNSAGWGFVNHSSNVVMEDNVAVNVAGSSFVTEAGDEIGAFRRNLAVRSAGSKEDTVARDKLQDFGHEGDGFWFQGGGVAVEENVAVGQSGAGFFLFTRGLEEDGLGRRSFPIANLPDPKLVPEIRRATVKNKPANPDHVSIGQVPVRLFKNNIACGCRVGIVVRFHLATGFAPRSTLEGGTVWNCRTGVELLYSSNTTLRNMRLVGNGREKTATAIRGGNEQLGGLRYENIRVEGWDIGLLVPESGDNVIDGGYFNNVRSIVVPTRLQRDRSVEIRGDIKFGTLPDSVLAGRKQYDIYLEARFTGFLMGPTGDRDPNTLFRPDVIRFGDKQIYYPEQAADFVPLPRDVPAGKQKWLGVARGAVPDELLDKTNRDLQDRYGLALGGAVAPPDVKTEPRIHGLVGKSTVYPQAADVSHPYFSKQLKEFVLRATGPDKKVVVESKSTDLKAGWNLLTVSAGDSRRSFLVYGGEKSSGYKPGNK